MKDSIVLLPYSDMEKEPMFKYMGSEVIIIHDNVILDDLIKKINKSKIKNIFLVNFINPFRKLLLKFDKSFNVHSIYTHDIGSLTNFWLLDIFQNIMEFYDRGLYKSVYFTNNELYSLLKNKKYNVSFLKLDTNKTFKNSSKSKSIAIISNDYNPNQNFYNALSAVKFAGINSVKIMSTSWENDRLAFLYNINIIKCKDEKELYSNNILNIYPCFCGYELNKILSSFDSGIPCLLGNIDIFDNYSVIKKYCILNSDDDICEISEKINLIIENKEDILKEYKKFRRDYNKK